VISISYIPIRPKAIPIGCQEGIRDRPEKEMYEQRRSTEREKPMCLTGKKSFIESTGGEMTKFKRRRISDHLPERKRDRKTRICHPTWDQSKKK